MKSTYYVFTKELRHYLYSPIAYVAAGVFHGIMGYFFYNSVVIYSRRVVEISGGGGGVPELVHTPTVMVLQGMFNSMGTIFMLLTPLITMRLAAEEKRGRTMELIMTSPIGLFSVVLGKYLAAYAIFASIIAATIYMPITVDVFSTVNWPHVASAYAGILLTGAAMISVGLFASTVTDKQVVAAVLSIGMLMILWFIGGGIGSASQRLTDFLTNVSLYKPFKTMLTGLVDFRDVFQLLSFAAGMVFLSYRALEADRW